jgi:hypothetical protein
MQATPRSLQGQRQRPMRSVLAALALLASSWAVAQSHNAPSPYDKQLQTIRQALLEATLETTPTQVISSSWIDNMGVLRETHEFNSKAEVRGVRWLAPAEENSQAAKVSVDVLPWGWRHDPKAGQSCAPAPRIWRLPLRVSTELAAGVSGPQQAASLALSQRVEQNMLAALQRSQRWTAMPVVAPEQASGNTYLNALAKTATTPASAGWQLNLHIEAQAPGANAPATWLENTTGLSLSSAAWHWNVRMSLRHSGQTGGATTGWQQTMPVRVEADKLAEHPTQWLSGMDSTLAPQLHAWLESIDKQLHCEPTPFTVRHTGQVLLLQAGQGSGLRPGDRVLLMQPGWVPSRMLDARAADHMALAEVVRVAPMHTDLRQLAGPPLPAGSEWVALPL